MNTIFPPSERRTRAAAREPSNKLHRGRVLLLSIASIITAPLQVGAETFTWTGSADGNWVNPANWDPGVPLSGLDTALVFDTAAVPVTTNNIAGGLTLNSLVFGPSSGPREVNGNALIFDGVSPTLSMQNATGTGHTILGTPLQLNQTLAITGGAATDRQLILNPSAVISGAGGLTWAGGFGFSNASSTYTGPTVIASGGFGIGSSNGFGNSSSVTIQNGAFVELQLSVTVNRPLILSGSGAPGLPTISAIGNNPEDGTAQYNLSGPITLTADASVGSTKTAFVGLSGPINLGSHTLTMGKGVTLSGAISLTENAGLRTTAESPNPVLSEIALGGRTLTVSGPPDGIGGFIDLSGVISGNGSLVLNSGTGNRVQLGGSGANTFTGPVMVESGTILVRGDSAFGQAENSLTLSGAALSLLNPTTIPGTRTITSGEGGFTVVPNSGTHTIAAAINGPGSVGISAVGIGTGGSLTLTAPNTFAGGLIIGSESSVRASSDAVLGTPGGAIRLNGGSLQFQSSFTLAAARALEIPSARGAVVAASGITATIASNVSGTGRLEIAGGSGGELGGTVALTGNNTHAGGVAIFGATLEVDSDARLGAPGGVLDIGSVRNTVPSPGRLRATGDLSVDASRSTAFRSAIVDTNGFSVTFNQPITGLGLTKDGAGVLRLNTANPNDTNDNPVAVNAGTLRLGINDALSPARSIVSVAEGAVLDLNGFAQRAKSVSGAGAIQLGTGGALLLKNSFGGRFDGPISGAGSVTLDNVSSYLLTGANTFSGGLTVRGGSSVVLTSTASLGAPGNPLHLDDGGLSTTALGTGPVVIDSSAPLTIGAGGATFEASGFPLVIAAPLAGAAPLRIRGGGEDHEVRFTSAANIFTADLQIGNGIDQLSGVLGIVADGSLGDAANRITLGYRFFDGETTHTGTGTVRAFADFGLAASRQLVLAGGEPDESGGVFDTNNFTVAVNGSIAEADPETPLLKRGLGTLLLNGSNSHTGETKVEVGTLGGVGSLEGPLRVSAGGTLAPGQSAGTFRTRDVTLASGATLALEFASSESADVLDVTGGLSLEAGVQLSLSLGFTPASAVSFLVVQNDKDDPVFGTFSIGDNVLEEGESFTSAGAPWTISYVGGSGNDVVLTVVPEPCSALATLLGAAMLLGCGRRRRARFGASLRCARSSSG